MIVKEDDDKNFFCGDWEWYQWTPIGNNYDDVPVPTINDRYNGRHEFQPMVAECVDTIL